MNASELISFSRLGKSIEQDFTKKFSTSKIYEKPNAN